MKFSIVVISLLSSAVVGHFRGRGSFRKPFSDVFIDQNRTAATAGDVIDLVRQTLQNASSGIASDDLVSAASRVKIAAISYLKANGSERVSREDVRALIKEVAAERNVSIEERIYGFRGVQLRVSSITDALILLDALANRAQELLDAGESPRVAIAAIIKLAKAVRWFAFNNTGGTVTYDGDNVANKTKRWLGYSFWSYWYHHHRFL